MNRRNALKKMSLALGYTLAAPTLFSMLYSCTSEAETWQPLFFINNQKYIVTQLADIILPPNEIVGAVDLNIPEFIDKMYANVASEEAMDIFKKGGYLFEKSFIEHFNKDPASGSKEEYNALLDTYFGISDESQEKIFQLTKFDEQEVIDQYGLNSKNHDDYLIYKFLLSVRYHSLYGFYTSEKIGEEVLSYDPIPGTYMGCIPLSDVGNAWSL
ncbi:MAG TPA: gluconate 2-dehydrogenase subunit 3 family protein [Gillisia sp.]|nr:gluconate 2-dehydrogenase subunit 3 family protein [Gillisia sp.]